jgi:DNA polymerase elongation subunit (family B)
MHLEPDGTAMRLYRREDAVTVSERVPFRPFLLVSDPAHVAGTHGLEVVRECDGEGALRYLAQFASWPAALAGRDRCRATPPLAFPGDPVQQFLLVTGRTCFAGLAFADLRRLALDIEVVTTEGYEFPNAARAGDRIVAVALADSTGFRHVVRGDAVDEKTLLETCARLVLERDPDVLEGHNIFRFDLPYLEARARRHGIALAWGRDGSVPRARPSRLQVAERSITFPRYEIAGRHVVDTWMLAQLHDVGGRDLPSFGLKDIARHLGVASTDRTYIDASDVRGQLKTSPDRLMAYAQDDAVETLAIAEILAPPYFAQAQVVPFDYQSTVLRGAAAKIDALLLREALRRGRAVPVPQAGTSVSGGYTGVFMRGVARPVLHVDVTSLYPSLMLAHAIGPASDDSGAFLALLTELRNFRVRAKRLARDVEDAAARAHFNAMQQSFKILINAFYGYLAFGNGHWNDYAAANRVTNDGRDVVTGILDALRTADAVPLEADTDGVYFIPPPGHDADDDETLLGALTRTLPEGIQLELDGRYEAMLSYKMKTYGLLDARGRVTLKGSGFRSRGLEPFQRRMIDEIVGLLLRGRGADVKAVVERWCADFIAHRVPVRLFARTETLHDTLEVYAEKVRAGERAPSAAYELASTAGTGWQPGDQVSYYVIGRGADVSVNDHARLATLWDPRHPDENTDFYHAKAQEMWTRFRDFATRDGVWPAEEDEPQLRLF